jgi:hypothetical protein
MASKSSAKLNLIQNSPEFKLEPLEEQSSIFKEKLLEKILDPLKNNPEEPSNYRTVTVKCLIRGCT